LLIQRGQVLRYDIPPQVGKATDSRASKFIARHGKLLQVELDALDQEVLRDLYREAIGEFWDISAYREAVALEAEERRSL
jgi:hypothetical protein